MSDEQGVTLPAIRLCQLEDPTPEKLYEFAMGQARRAVENQREVSGVLLLLDTEGTVALFPAFAVGLSKDTTAALHESISRDPRFVACAFVCEAWMSLYKNPEEADSAPPPSEDPQRKEAVVCVIKTAGRVASMQAMIDRDTNTLDVPAFQWSDAEGAPTATGRFIDRHAAVN